jgi:Raf kinase inhibitor-like YbhB/YbcL family protein
MTIQVSSTAFAEGETIPKKYTDDGDNVSPPLQWSGAPPGTQSFALIADDPDAPLGTWVHWVIFNLPAGAPGLPEGVPTQPDLEAGVRQGKNSFRDENIGYGGPSPPKGKPHRYFFKVYALDTPLNLPGGATKAQVEAAMKGHVLAQGQLMGKYGR